MKALLYKKKDADEILHRLRDIPMTVAIDDDVPVIVSKKGLEGLESLLEAKAKELTELREENGRLKNEMIQAGWYKKAISALTEDELRALYIEYYEYPEENYLLEKLFPQLTTRKGTQLNS